MPKNAAKVYNWRLESHRRSPRILAMEACKSPPAKQTDLQIYSRDRKRQKLKHVQHTAPKRVKTAEGDAHEYHPCPAEQLTGVPSTSCMPDKRMLELILDILQRRDTHEIFAEPVDPNEVEGYYEIIKEPMDFGTMRAKLREGLYSSLEQFERDVFLISRNAMQFNSSATIYFRQARAIHELAKRVFNSLKMDPEGFSSNSQTRRRNSRRVQNEAVFSLISPGSNLPVDTKSGRVSVGESSKALLHSSSRSPDKTRACPKRSSSFATYNYEVLSGDRNGELNSCTELNRRSTYRLWTSSFNDGKAVAISICNNSKQLMPVDLTDVSYKESLMLFAKSLGPTAQRIAIHKLQFASNFTETRPSIAEPLHILGQSTHSLAGDAPITCINVELNAQSGSYSSSLGFTPPNFSGRVGSGKVASMSTRMMMEERKRNDEKEAFNLISVPNQVHLGNALLSAPSGSDILSSSLSLKSKLTFNLPYQSNSREWESFPWQDSEPECHTFKNMGGPPASVKPTPQGILLTIPP